MPTNRVTLYTNELLKLFNSRQGPVVKHLLDTASKVQRYAKQQVGKDTRNLERSIGIKVTTDGRRTDVWVGSERDYAKDHHDGTRPHIILPRFRKVLRFKVRGFTVFATRVNHPGTRPNRYLTDSLRKAVR